MIKVTYLDHSGFVVATPQAYLVFDFYKDPDKKFEHAIDADRKLPVIFFVSHHHPDHFNKSIFELCQDRDHAYVLSNDIFSDLVPQKGLSVAWVSAGDVIDSLPGGITVKAYGSTDAGVSFMVTLADGSRVFHAGDLNDWHWQDESSEREVAKAESKFKTIVDRIACEVPEIKIAMFPVDARQGTDFARGAEIFLKSVKVDYFFPMHFFGESGKACDFSDYIPVGVKTTAYCLDHPGMSAKID